MSENEISKVVFECGLKVHRYLGPGLLENAYKECLYHEIGKSGLRIEKEKTLPVYYDSIRIELGYRLDLIVEDKLIVELKAVEELNDIHFAQLLTYLKLTNCKLGMLMNFNTDLFKNGVRRVVNNMNDD